MKQAHALRLAVVAGVLTIATIGLLGYRLAGQASAPDAGMPPGLLSSQQLTPEQAQAEVEAIMALTLDDLDGRPQAIAQWRGKILVINYWASWCKPCVEEMPAFASLQSRHAGQGVQFVGIGIDDAEKMRRFVQVTPVSYPLLVAGDAASQTPGLQVKALPYTVIIGRDGRFESSRLGRLDEAKLEPILRRLIAR